MSKLKHPKRLQSFQTPSHARAPKQEGELAAKLGGRRVKGSGCGDEKGDVRLEGVARIECKTTKAKSFSVTREMIKKVEEAALNAGEVPVIVVEFIDAGKYSDVAVIPMWALELLLGRGE